MRAAAITAVAAAALLPTVTAFTIPDLFRSFVHSRNIQKRCDNPCGYYHQVCCGNDEICYTNEYNQAACQASVSGSNNLQGTWRYTTSTYVMTNRQTVTTTLSSFVPATSSSCRFSEGESSCGSVCCAAGEFCESSAKSKCKDTGSGNSGLYSSLFTVTTVITNTADAPLRPTSDVLVTVTATGTAGGITTTQGFISPTGTVVAEPQNGGGGGGNGLSAGAIAGIVIGVLAAIIILILICLCCCAKSLLDTILGIFGLGSRSRRRKEEVEVYERRSHHGSRRGRSTSTAPKRTWFGSRPKRTSVTDEKRSSWVRGASVAAFLGGLAAFLGLKRRRNRRDDKSSVSYGSSYYSSDYTSSTESSSDRRTRRSSRSRSRAYSQSRR